jgi:PAS domain S-box-containing protein
MQDAPVDRLRPEDLGLAWLFGHLREPVLVADSSTGRVVLWNPAAERLFGCSAAEIIGQSLDSLIPEPARAPLSATLAGFATAGTDSTHAESREVLLPVPMLSRSGAELAVDNLVSRQSCLCGVK